jgi:hypothetical protein
MLQPARSTFWRFTLLVTFLFVLLAIWDLIQLAGRLNVQILARPAWLGAVSALGLFDAILLVGFAAGFSKAGERIWGWLEFPSVILPKQIGIILALVGLLGFSMITSLAAFKEILSGEEGARILIFWLFSLLGMWGIKIFRKETTWLNALITMSLAQATIHLLSSYWPAVTSYPFALGWSETSRYYFPSLFLSENIYGQKYPLPILHPTLHLLLTPPYWFDAPLWVHRFWQVAIRYLLLGATVPAMLSRVSIQDKGVRWLVGLWIFLLLFLGPIYFHLVVPVILVLIGFSLRDDRRTLRRGSAQAWFVILLASAWCGWSRVNWYPMPAIIAATLYVLETPVKGKSLWQYLWRPALWGILGTLTAFAFQRWYIAISGVADSRYFYTSVASHLMWYRLLPNATFPVGLLPAALLTSLPSWIAMYIVLRTDKGAFHPVRLIFVIGALIALFIACLFVSLKIGGGADLHNMDAYFVVLLIVFLYLVFARYAREDFTAPQPVTVHWLVVVALLIFPIWAAIQPNLGFGTFDSQRTQAVLEDLQTRIDQVNAQGGEVLFITQRHLISMGMLKGVTLIPEYEREDLMEMAMADNELYLDQFRRDLENQRFALIVVDPLSFLRFFDRRSFAEENNAWNTRVAKHILCNYRKEAIFPEDDIALYVPQTGERQCP